ncbi:MAG: acetate/propionate family kinase [Pseudomonadota bacterium]
MSDALLTLNAGSSSLKFSVFTLNESLPRRAYSGAFDRGSAPDRVTLEDAHGNEAALTLKVSGELASAMDAVLAWCEGASDFGTVKAVGHRVVHGGMHFDAPQIVTPEVMAKLEELSSLAPLHQPHNLSGIAQARAAFPQALQVACFDTAFHRTHPFVNDTFALPHRFYDEGVRRYGFHGVSYDYITSVLPEDVKAGRTVIAHLGNGASMCALVEGKSVGSSMGFSALDGLPMGTRCGQIDPGVLIYLMQTHGMNADEIATLLYKESGLKGMSGLSNDMRELLASHDPRARQAIDYFVFRIRRELGGMTAVMQGLDTLIFTGGIGENAAEIRKLVCQGFDWLGLLMDDEANHRPNGSTGHVISHKTSRVRVMVIPTDEEARIAHYTSTMLPKAELGDLP